VNHTPDAGSAHGGPVGSVHSGRFTGVDGTGCVEVEIDPDVTLPRVTIGHGWRSAVRPEGLGPAVLQAFGAATIERLTALAAVPGRRTVTAGSAAPQTGAAALPAGTAGVHLVRRAQNDLEEFRARLAGLVSATRTASSPDHRVTVTVRGGNIIGIDLARAWREEARDGELESHLDDGLRAALHLIATTPQQALDGCPYLLDVLAAAPGALPFALPVSSPVPSPIAGDVPPTPLSGFGAEADRSRSVRSPSAGRRSMAAPTNADW
jgi:hypothetical protein